MPKNEVKRLVNNWGKAASTKSSPWTLCSRSPGSHPIRSKIGDFYTDKWIENLSSSKMLMRVDSRAAHVTLSAGSSSGSGKAGGTNWFPRASCWHRPASKQDRHTSTPLLVSISNQFVPLWQPFSIWHVARFFWLNWDFRPILVQPWPLPELLTFIPDMELVGTLVNWWNFPWKLPK